MRDDTFAEWLANTERLEGKVPWCYLDVKGLVTVGVGNLIDDPGRPGGWALALRCPFVRNSDGQPANDLEIIEEWKRVKGQPDLARLGHRAAKAFTRLHLTDEGIAQIVRSKLAQNENFLRVRFTEYDTWPQTVIQAVNALAWACGAAFRFPKLEDALRERDWSTCAKECHIDAHGNPGVVPRNAWMQELFERAAAECAPTVPEIEPHETAPVDPPDDLPG